MAQAGKLKQNLRYRRWTGLFLTVGCLLRLDYFCWEIIATLGTVGILYNDVVPHIWNIVIAIYEELTPSFYRDRYHFR